GLYSVIVEGSDAVTKHGMLLVNAATSLVPLSHLTLCPGTSASFLAQAGGTGPFQFVWSKDGTSLIGQTNKALELPAIAPSDAGTYSVEVSGPCGSARSSGSLTVLGPDECVLRIVAIEQTGATVVIHFNTLSGHTYQLERTDSLAQPTWIAVADPIPGPGI